MKNKISVIIVNWNNSYYLKKCLRSLLPIIKDGNELIVIDNNSDDQSRMTMAQFDKVIKIYNDKNEFFAKGNNQGFKKATKELILVLNPDTIVNPQTLYKIATYLFKERNRGVGVVTCRFLNPNRTLQTSYHRRLPNWKLITFCHFVTGHLIDKYLFKNRNKRYYFDSYHHFNKPVEIEQAPGTFMLIDRKIIGQYIFDENFPLFFNDVDFSLSIRKRGYKIILLPQFNIIHYGGRGVKKVSAYKRAGQYYFSLLKYLKKHHRIAFIFFPFWFMPLLLSDFLLRMILKGRKKLGLKKKLKMILKKIKKW